MRERPLTHVKLALLTLLGIGICAAPAQVLTHRYSFNDTAGSPTFADSVGGSTGNLNNTGSLNPNSASLDGAQLQMDGTGGYAVLPAGLLSTNTQATIEFWAS